MVADQIIHLIVHLSSRSIRKIAKLLELNKQNLKVYNVLSEKIRVLAKKLDDYHSEYNTLEKKVKRLERDVYSLKDKLDDPKVCVNRETVIDLIHKIVS